MEKSLVLADYNTLQGYNCIFSNVYNTLRYCQIDIYEHDLFFWFSGFSKNRNIDNLFEIIYNEKNSIDWQRFIELNIRNNTPVLAHIDPKILSHVKFNEFDTTVGHYINIIGINVHDKKLLISDSYVPTYIPSTYTGWIDYSSIEDNQIKACWSINRVYINNFFQERDAKYFINFTHINIIKSLINFLLPDEDNNLPAGISKLKEMPQIIHNYVQNKKYDEMFKLLAGIRLHIINPLIYLSNSLDRYYDRYDNLLKSLNNFIEDYWESLNMQLIKFSIAHKKLDSKIIASRVKDVIFMEEEVLKNILETMTAQY